MGRRERVAPGIEMVPRDPSRAVEIPTPPSAPKSRFGYLRGNGSEVASMQRTLPQELAKVYTEGAPRDPLLEQLEITLARRNKHSW